MIALRKEKIKDSDKYLALVLFENKKCYSVVVYDSPFWFNIRLCYRYFPFIANKDGELYRLPRKLSRLVIKQAGLSTILDGATFLEARERFIKCLEGDFIYIRDDSMKGTVVATQFSGSYGILMRILNVFMVIPMYVLTGKVRL